MADEVVNEIIENEKGEKITRLKGMIRARVGHANEGDGQAFRDVLTILCGKKWDEVNQQFSQYNDFRHLLTDAEARMVETKLLQPDNTGSEDEDDEAVDTTAEPGGQAT